MGDEQAEAVAKTKKSRNMTVRELDYKVKETWPYQDQACKESVAMRTANPRSIILQDDYAALVGSTRHTLTTLFSHPKVAPLPGSDLPLRLARVNGKPDDAYGYVAPVGVPQPLVFEEEPKEESVIPAVDPDFAAPKEDDEEEPITGDKLEPRTIKPVPDIQYFSHVPLHALGKEGWALAEKMDDWWKAELKEGVPIAVDIAPPTIGVMPKKRVWLLVNVSPIGSLWAPVINLAEPELKAALLSRPNCCSHGFEFTHSRVMSLEHKRKLWEAEELRKKIQAELGMHDELRELRANKDTLLDINAILGSIQLEAENLCELTIPDQPMADGARDLAQHIKSLRICLNKVLSKFMIKKT